MELVSERSFTEPFDDCPEPERWHARDNQATETEVSALLKGFCIALRPHRVLETGAYEGDSTVEMGKALLGWGHLDSLEVDPERAQRVRDRTADLPVAVHMLHSLDWTGADYDFAFFDSDPAVRPREMRMFAKPGAVWALHDAKWPEVQAALRELQADGVIGTWITLPTPRGLSIGRYLKGV